MVNTIKRVVILDSHDLIPLEEKIKQYKRTIMFEVLDNYNINEFRVKFSIEGLEKNEINSLLNDFVRDDMTYWYQGKKIDYDKLKDKIIKNSAKLTTIVEVVN